MFKRIILFLILSLSFVSLRSATTINAQCVTGNVTGEWLGTADGRQTFSPTISGTLYKVRVHTATYGSSTNITVRILSGSPGSGSLLTSLTYFKGASLNSWDDVVFPGNGIPVTATSPYYIEIAVGSQVDWIKASTNVYAGGSAWRGMTNYNNNDFNFEVHLTVAACGALTPGPNQTGIIANTASSPLALNAGGDPGNWTSSGAGVFADPHNPNSTYTPSCSEAGSTTTLTWTSSCNLSSVTQTISVPFPSLSVNNANICPGGTATLNAVGGSAYTWSANAGGATTSSVNVTPGTTTIYTVTSTLANGCVVSLTPTVTVNPLPSANSGADQTICEGSGMSNFTITPSGGTPGYIYEWYNVPTGGTPISTNQIYSNGPPAGTYTYYGLVKDVNNCVSPRDPVQLTVYPNPTMMSVSSTPVDCFGNSTGTLSGNASGGTAPYQYTFDGAPPYYTNPIINLPVGSYTLYTKDANGCLSSNWMMNSIGGPSAITITPSSTNINCFGAADGSASVFASGGTGGFTYSWSPIGGTTSTASPLPPGTYTCNVSDANSCPASYTFAITQPAALTVSSVGQNNVTCSSGSNGSATVSASGGTGGYTYSWAPFGGTAATATGLMAGNYTCTVTDANGCTASQIFTINQPLNVTISSNSQTNVSCFGGTTGAVSVNPATGGSGFGYQYSLNGGGFGGAPSFTGLTAGSYTVTARDNNLCPSNSVVFTLTQQSAITLGTSGNSAPCSGTALSVALAASGGVAGYSYSWKAVADNPNTTGENFSAFTNNDSINNIITNLNTAAEVVSYSVNVTDANGCVANFSVPTTIAPAPTLVAISNQVVCAGASSAAIVFTSSIGGSTISWTNSSPSIGIAGSGTTNIAATSMVNVGATPVVANFSASANFSGCTGPTQTFNITVNPLPSLTSSATPSTICQGSNSAFSVSGADTYNWNPAAFLSSPTAANPTFTGSSSGAYTYTVTGTVSATSCSNTSIVNITVNPTPTLPTLTSNSPVCTGGTLNLGTPSVATTYAWTGPNAFASNVQNPTIAGITAAGTGTYSLTITSAAGCSATVATIGVVINALPTATISYAGTPYCATGSATVTQGGQTGGTYSSSAGLIINSSTGLINLASSTPGVYTVTYSFTNGTCANTTTAPITINPLPTAPVAGSNSPVCSGNSINLTATLVAGTYSWTGPSAFSSAVQNPTRPGATGLMAGTYSVTVTSGGCTSTIATTNVVVNSTPATPTPSGTSTLCAPWSNNFSTGAVAGASYNWVFGDGNTSTLQNPTHVFATAGSYTTSLTVTVLGCTSNAGTFITTANPTPATPTITNNAPICEGGTLNLTTPAIGTYNWSGPNGFTSTLQNPSIALATVAATGTYSLIVTSSGCNSAVATTNVTINALPTPSITAGGPLTFCSGNTVTFTASPNTGVNYQWKNGAANVGTNTSTYTTGNAGNHTVVVTDLITGCSGTSNMLNVNVDANPIITSVTPSSSSICNSSSTLITLSQSGGNSYSWSPSVSLDNSNIQNPTASPTSTTIYTVVVTNTLTSCSSSSTTVVNVTNAPTVSGTVTDVTCFGASNGVITINAAGGTPSYSYSLDNVSFVATNTFNGLPSGSYTLYVKDINNCTGQNTAIVSQPASGFLVASSSSTNICSGQAWGETFSSSGGFGSITYSWVAQPPTNVTGASSGSGNTINELLTATTTNPYSPETVIYDLFATDQNGCNATSTFTVYVNPLPTVSLSSDVNPICLSSVANLTATPTSDFFGWLPITDLTIVNGSSATFTPSTIGNIAVTYTVAMNTGANCTNTGVITLTVTPSPTAPVLASNSPICAGSSINLTSNTIASATYAWNGPNGFTSSLEDPSIGIATPADAGTYTCTVNVGGCTSSSTTNVAISPKPQAIVLGVSTTFCANETFTLDGTNSLHNSSSITNYQWQLGGSNIAGATAATYTGNTPGNYQLVVTNDLGCTDVTITPNVANADPIPTPIINGVTSFCTGNNITLDAFSSSAGGASVIDNYEWLLGGTSVSSGPTNDTYLATVGGDYQLIVLNSNGCKDTTVLFTITENPIPSLPSVTPDPINVCVGSSTNISVNSPVVGSTYTWASINAETSVSFTTGNSNTVNGLTSGIASITVTETNSAGCTGPTYSVTVNINSAPTATASFTSNDTICYNGNASVALNLMTGATYNWTSSIGNTSTSQSVTFNNITTTGNVQFYGTITDGVGCTSVTDTINLFVQNQPTVPVISNASSVCPGQGFTLNVNPVISGANYFWTDPSATTQNAIDLTSITIPIATAITAGPYVVYYIDPLGCTSATSSLYNQPLDPSPIVSISGLTTICSGNSTTLTASTSIGSASTYQWYSNGTAISAATSASFNVTTPGNYNVQIILSTGCFDTAAVATTVNVSSGPTVVANPTSSTICSGNGATISASGAVSYSWDSGATTASITVNPVVTTSYIVTGTDASGCANNDTAVVIVNALPATPVITAGSTTECAGTNVSLSSNATLAATWINTSTLGVIGTTQNISHTETVAGVYNYGVYVTDANLCNSATATIGVTFNSCLTALLADNASTNSNIPVSGNFLTNDGSPSIFTTVNIISGPSNGTMTVSTNGNFTYTPNANFSGYEMIVAQVCDVTPTCLNDTIYIVVNPNLIGDTYTINGLTTPNTIIGNVLLNDAGLGISGNVVLVNSVTNGILVIDSLGNFTYTPNAGFCGNDLFTYSTCDQNSLCANAGVNLIITCDSSIVTNTAFSPNGDGVNDNWVIQGIETTQNTVTVFDRWGNQVITITNYNNTSTSWNGKNSNGIELPAGTYFYSIDIVNEKPKKGWVEITK